MLRRELGEALLENGERAAGLKALEEAMTGLEKSGELGAASSITEELLRVEPNSVRYHQKRVEYAVRSSDRPRLVDAYLALAECLFRSGQLDKSRAVYGRVVELAPDDARARTAMQDAFGTREIPVATLQAVEAEAAAGRRGRRRRAAAAREGAREGARQGARPPPRGHHRGRGAAPAPGERRRSDVKRDESRRRVRAAGRRAAEARRRRRASARAS